MMGFLWRLKRTLRRWGHAMQHRLGNNSGTITTWWEGDSNNERLMMGFKCDTCGKIGGIHESIISQRMRERKERYRDL